MIGIFNKTKKARVCEAAPFIFEQARTSRKSKAYKEQIRLNANRLREYEESRGVTLYSDSLTYQVCEDLEAFLKGKGYLLNTVTGVMVKLFTSFNRMAAAGYDVCAEYKNYPLKKESVTTVYLDSREIMNIYALKLTRENSVIRDLFVVGCLTGMRYSDFSTLSAKNIIGGVIVKKTKKTGVHIEVPIHPVVAEIIDRYGGFPPYADTQQNFNRVIKTICKRAGIKDKVYIERTRGDMIERLSIPRYKLVSSHTARRSFATNAYLAGIPAARIMLLTGHSTEDSFFRYIRISKSENARTLSEHPFFTGG